MDVCLAYLSPLKSRLNICLPVRPLGGKITRHEKQKIWRSEPLMSSASPAPSAHMLPTDSTQTSHRITCLDSAGELHAAGMEVISWVPGRE